MFIFIEAQRSNALPLNLLCHVTEPVKSVDKQAKNVVRSASSLSIATNLMTKYLSMNCVELLYFGMKFGLEHF